MYKKIVQGSLNLISKSWVVTCVSLYDDSINLNQSNVKKYGWFGSLAQFNEKIDVFDLWIGLG